MLNDVVFWPRCRAASAAAAAVVPLWLIHYDTALIVVNVVVVF